MRLYTTVVALALVSSVFAQNATYCSGGACFVVNVPAATASSGSGDIYFQISGPTSMSWIGLGQGPSMSGANIFMIYSNSAGTNVTLSPRLGTGFRQPAASTAANVVLLEGSGIKDNVITANVRCSNCNSWSGGSMNFASATSSWIWAYRTGSAISSDSVSANLAQHNFAGTINLNLQSAAGGNSNNPFVATAGIATSSQSPSSSSSSSPSPSSSPSLSSTYSPSSTPTSAASNGNGNTASSSTDSSGSSDTPKYDSILMAHAIVGPVAWVLLFPIGSIAIRTLSFRGLVWVHAGWMVLTYMLVISSMGLGIWLAVYTGQLDTYHSIIGLVAVGCLLFQPVTGLAHHLLYKRQGRPNAATYPHVWWGRAVITLGIINGGLGLQLADNTRNGEIIYGVVAGFMWILWMVVIVIAFIKSKRTPKGETGESLSGGKEKSQNSDESMLKTPSL